MRDGRSTQNFWINMPPYQGSVARLAYVLYFCMITLVQILDTRSQTRLLYVFDPKALQSIIIKDQQYSEEAAFTIS